MLKAVEKKEKIAKGHRSYIFQDQNLTLLNCNIITYDTDFFVNVVGKVRTDKNVWSIICVHYFENFKKIL